jgi:hypothetical protein
MANVDWYVEGVQFGNCNCSYGCPCQFEALPTQGNCRGFEALRIDRGHFGNLRLDGLHVALLYAWPGPIFDGNGEMQAIVDERASAEQREALVKILHGEETDDAATHWWVYHAMSSTVHEVLFRPFEFACDIEARTARVRVPGVVESTGRPILNTDGEAHRVRIDIPNGIEFELAEVGAAESRADAAIQIDIRDGYGQFNVLRHSGSGVVKS